MKLELLPCPFCGKETEQPKCFMTGESDDGYIYCTHCKATSPPVDCDEIGDDDEAHQPWHILAQAAWNRRT